MIQPINRIADHFNPDGSVKAAGQVKQPEAMPVNPADVLANATSNPSAQTSAASTAKLHQAPLPELVASRISDFEVRLKRFLIEEPSNDLDKGFAREKTQGQKTLEALFAEIQAANRESVAAKLGNRNLLQLDQAVPEAPKLLGDIVEYVNGNKELQGILSDDTMKNSVLNLIAYSMTVNQLKDVFSAADKDTQIRVANLSETVSPVKDTLNVLSVKGKAFFEEFMKALKPFMKGYSEIVDANVQNLTKLVLEKSPELMKQFSATNPADLAELSAKFVALAPQLGEVVKGQSSSIGNLMADWMQKNAKPLFGLLTSGLGLVRTIMNDIMRTVPGAQRAPTAEELNAQMAA